MRLPRVRLTVRRTMIVIALVGLATFAIREVFFANTVYSPGYSDSRFRQIRVGMTTAQVEGLMGPPLEMIPWSEQGLEIWCYSKKPSGRGDYWRRDLFVKGGRVCQILDMYWFD